jgi:hypothetical protein
MRKALKGDSEAPSFRAERGAEGVFAEIPDPLEIVVAADRFGHPWETTRRPVEPARLADHPGDAGAMAADEFRGGVEDHVGAPLHRSAQVRGGEGGVDDERQVVIVRDIGECLEVGHCS